MARQKKFVGKGESHNEWSEAKTPKTFRLTQTAIDRLTAWAEAMGLTNTDIIERSARMLNPFAPRIAAEELPTLAALVDRYFSVLKRNLWLNDDRLELFREGAAVPTAIELCRIAMTLGLSEDEIRGLVEGVADEGLADLLLRLWEREEVSDVELAELSHDLDLPVVLLHKIRQCLLNGEKKSDVLQ